MNDTTTLETAVNEDDAILPEGWTGEADLFDLPDDDFFADEKEEKPAVVAQPAEEPTTAQDAAAAPTDHAEPSAEEYGAPTTEQTNPAAEQPSAKKFRFSARVDHEDQEVEVDENDLPTIYQKSMATDRYQAKLAKVNPLVERMEHMAKINGYESVEAMLDAQEAFDRENLVNKLMQEENASRTLAEDYVNRHYGRPAPAQSAPADPGKAAEAVEAKTDVQTNNPPARDFATEVQELWSMRPDLKGTKIPSEVAAAAADGQNLALAYFAYEANQARATAEQLRQENNTYKQNAATAAKAPVKGVSGGGATNTEPEDPFLKGFDSAW